MKPIERFSLLLFLLFSLQSINAQSILNNHVNPKDVTIIRDEYGVPHIYGKTDADVAYGLGWAIAEDDFETLQMMYYALHGRAGEVFGKKNGAPLDVIAFACNLDKVVDAKFDTAFSDEFRKVLAAKVQATNDYATAHPEEVLLKDMFPMTEKEVIKLYVFGNVVMSNAVFDIARVIEDKLSPEIHELASTGGSNAWAFNSDKTDDGTSWMVSNTHQPLEGPFSWYEAHVESEEGWKMIGANFPIGITLFLGTTPNLGWTHTVNFPDLSDVYKLTMNPKNKKQYELDGEWYDLEERTLKFKVKVGGIKVPVKRTFYWSDHHGVVANNKDGFYAIRMPALMDVRSAEQWYWMNKAQNFDEFKEALSLQGIASLNTIYADKDNNIFHLSNGLCPKDRAEKPNLNWTGVIEGNKSENIWSEDFYTIDEMPHSLNPQSGYLYNTNNSPFTNSGDNDCLSKDCVDATMCYLTKENNRSLRFQELMKGFENKKVTFEDLKKMKYDIQFNSETFYSCTFENMDDITNLDPKKYPKLADVIETTRRWNRRTDIDNTDAAIMSMTVYNLIDLAAEEIRMMNVNTVPEDLLVKAMKKAKKHLKKHFGTIHVPLGELQRHVRGDVNLPISGMPDNLAAMIFDKHKKGRLKSYHGDSYIQFARYDKDGVVSIESMMAFGNSRREDSPHYTDQMEMYVNKELKKMTFDKEEIKKNAKATYYPGEISWR